MLRELGQKGHALAEGIWGLSQAVRGREDLPRGEVMNRWGIWGPAGRQVRLECKIHLGQMRAKAGNVSRAQIGEVFD